MSTAFRNDAILITLEEADELISVDGSINETHVDSNLFTQFPVGKGSLVSDHSQPAPPLVSVDLYITDTPKTTPETNIPAGFQVAAQKARVHGSADASINVQNPTELLQRGKAIYERLLQAMRDSEIMTVQTSRRTYQNMTLTRLEHPVSSSERGYILVCDFQQITFAESERVPIIVVAQPGNQNPSDRGVQEPTVTEPESVQTETIQQSTLFQITN